MALRWRVVLRGFEHGWLNHLPAVATARPGKSSTGSSHVLLLALRASRLLGSGGENGGPNRTGGGPPGDWVGPIIPGPAH